MGHIDVQHAWTTLMYNLAGTEAAHLSLRPRACSRPCHTLGSPLHVAYGSQCVDFPFEVPQFLCCAFCEYRYCLKSMALIVVDHHAALRLEITLSVA